MDARLEAAMTPDGRRRFYVPGAHPATARWRAEVRSLERLPASAERDEALEYARGQIALFEAGESEAKERYLRGRTP